MVNEGCVRSTKDVPWARDDEIVNILHDTWDNARSSGPRMVSMVR